MIDGLQQTNISLSRGIVRTPSLGEDGELSECVNLIPHKGEIVRIKEPQPVMEIAEGEQLIETNRCVGVENYIVRHGGTLKYYRGSEAKEICSLTEGEVEVVTIGQTIVVSQGTTKRYFVWSEEGYKEQDLLNAAPKVELVLGDKGFVPEYKLETNSSKNGFSTFTWEVNAGKLALEQGPLEVVYWSPGDKGDAMNTSFWGRYNEIRKRFKDSGAHCFPFYVRWGVELYDGSITNLSAPILMMPSSVIRPWLGWYLPDIFKGYITGEISAKGEKWTLGFTPRNFYVAIDASELKDIDSNLIKGLVVYATPEIEAVDTESPLFVDNKQVFFLHRTGAIEDALGWDTAIHINNNAGSTATVQPSYINYTASLPIKKDVQSIVNAFNDPVEFYEMMNIPWELIRSSNYKVVASYSEGKLPPDRDGEEVYPPADSAYTTLVSKGFTLYQVPLSLETLTSQATLSSRSLSSKEYTVAKSNSTYSYNSRLMYGGVELKVPHDIKASQFIADNRLPGMKESSSSDTSLYAKISSSYLTIDSEGILQGYKGESPVIAFPYKEAQGLAITSGDWSGKISFQRNNSSLGGYSLWSGITADKLLKSPDIKECFLKQSVVEDEWKTNSYLESKDSDLKGNTIALTKVGNPWVIEQVTELVCGEIYALTSATEALSEGQFGEFPVYAFTDTGIYALSIAQDGTIEAKQAISRDVLLGKNTTLQIDKAVIYPTKEGLKIISGRNTSLLSSAIDGLNISETDFKSSIPDELNITDTHAFQEQLANMQMVYDYAHGQIHLFYKGEADLSKPQKHYVYDIESQQWASQILDTQLTTVVAGYPFSTMQFGNKLMQYTNALEADVVRSGWLLTRPIAFDDPWARKMIADIRIMAQKTNQDSKVSLAIYTSDYRVNWRKLTSLKSRSAKWYRFLIKADFCGLDSLSGITCRWVQRLGNKLR